MNNPRVGIGVLIFNPQRHILLGQRMDAHGKFTYGPPGGHLEFGESFEGCAIREVQEETGLVILSPEFLAITNDVFSSKEKHYVSIFMHTTLAQTPSIQNLEPHKTKNWQWFPFSQLPFPLFLPLQQLIDKKSYGLAANFLWGEYGLKGKG